MLGEIIAGNRIALIPREPALVVDLKEGLQRPIVDRTVLEFEQSHTFHPTDFTITGGWSVSA